MSFKFENSGIAASVFLALYVVYTALTIKIVHNEGWNTIYTSLLIHGVFRVGGQLCGVAFAAIGWDQFGWLIGYLVLSAEGYFVLILTAYHLIAKAQYQVVGYSWIRPNQADIKAKVAAATTARGRFCARVTPARVFHAVLIPANAYIISGGSMLAGLSADELNNGSSKVSTSRGLRTAGQAVFLAQTIVAVAFAIKCYFNEKVKHYNIIAVFIAAPFLLVRGIFGILSIFVDKMDYYLITNYTANGLSPSFVAFEYCLGTSMEFITASVFVLTYYIERRQLRRKDLEDINSDVAKLIKIEDKDKDDSE
ncbi:uncharacterized protein RJT20DRAFT_16360 [Scheffersomyces xylosifermentans]|uniref:uncharacterized protein n=1 Tax=Scheffersomyces xylosifermentans TaxID=1304137 RepID=UPI00315C8F5B